MAISDREATEILQLARNAGITDDLIEDWTADTGAYRYALTSNNATNPKARAAAQIRARVTQHIADREHAAITQAAEAAGITPPHAPGTPLATDRQIDYILGLLKQRRITGEGGGFFQGPTDRAGIAALSRAEASTYITSLKDEY